MRKFRITYTPTMLTPTDGLEARLKAVRAQMAAHHDRTFGIDTSVEAMSRRLGLKYTAPQRPGPGFEEDGR